MQEANSALHCIGHPEVGKQYNRTGQVSAAFSKALKKIASASSQQPADEKLGLLTKLMKLTFNQSNFAGEVWTNEIFGCGGGVIGDIAEALSAL